MHIRSRKRDACLLRQLKGISVTNYLNEFEPCDSTVINNGQETVGSETDRFFGVFGGVHRLVRC
jgi:hypothetical protein